jgi:hypothetical protein
MVKIKKLNDVENISEFILSIKDKELIIYEDIQGSKIYVNWDGEKFIIKPKSINNEPLNFIDLTMQVFYNSAFKYFNSLPTYVTELLNKTWWFCFEYFPDNQPANINYERLPKNNLILTCILKGTKYKYNYNEIIEYSNLFDVDPLPVLYKGILSNKQLEIIELYLRTSEKDSNFIFGEKNFTYFFYKILNPQLKNSFLMNSNNYNDNIEKLILKIDEEELSFELLNPLYKKLNMNTYTDYVDTYTLILLSFLNYIQLINLKIQKLKSLNKDDMYVELISLIYNEYMENMEKDILKMEIDIPEFFKNEKFKINIDLIKNEKTKDFIKTNSKYEYVFKCILGSFNKRKNKSIGIFNEQTVVLFNKTVDDINKHIESNLNINLEYNYQKSDIKNFEEFWKIKYNTDLKGEIYPDVYDEFDDTENSKDKKSSNKKDETKKDENQIDNDFNLEKENLK